MVEETAETDDGTVEDPPQGPHTVIASEDSSQPLLATDTTLDAAHTPGAAELLARDVEAPAQETPAIVHTPAAAELPPPPFEAPIQDMAENFPQQALGKMLAYSDSANVVVTVSRHCSPSLTKVASQDSSARIASGLASPMSKASLLSLMCPMQVRSA